jgi:hypothetical protein
MQNKSEVSVRKMSQVGKLTAVRRGITVYASAHTAPMFAVTNNLP